MDLEDIEMAVRRLIAAEMPEDADVVLESDNDLVYSVLWQMQSDPQKLDKLSRMIEVILPNALVQDLVMMQDAEQTRAFDAMRADIRKRRQLFDSAQDHQSRQSPPVEVWVLSLDSNVLH